MKNQKKSWRLTTLLKISLLSCAIGLHGGETNAAPPIFTSSFNGAAGGFDQPYFIAIDPATGNLYVTDSINSRVQVFDTLGNPLFQFGTPGIGNGQFTNPYGIAFGNGSVYVTDADFFGATQARVQVFDPNGNYLSQYGSLGGGVPQFDNPAGTTVDANGNIFTADFLNQRIQRFTPAGAPLGPFGGPGGVLNGPEDLVFANGNIYITDYNNNSVFIFDGTTFTPTGQTLVPTAGGFNGPSGVAMGAGGSIYVADSGNSRVQIFNPNGTFREAFGDSTSSFWGIVVENTTGKIYTVDDFNNLVNQWFSPVEWTQAGTSQLMQLPLNQALTLNNGFDLQVQNALSLLPGGNLTINPGGTLTSGTITLNGGSITDNANTTLPTPMDLTTGTFNSGAGNTFTYSGNINGANTTLNIGGTGSVALTGNNTFTGNITVLSGASLSGNTASFNNNPITNSLNGTLTFDQAADGTFGGAITSPGFFSKSGVGNLTLTNPANTFEFLENVQLGKLTGTAATLNAKNIRNLATLVFNQPTDATFGANILGQGTLVKQGAGNLTLTGDNDFSAQGGTPGQIIINGGTLTGNTGSINAPIITNNAALVFNQLNNGVFMGQISGPGSVSKTGPGTLNFTTTQTYSGATNINQGVFTLNGGLSNSAVSVAQGATIMGNGSMKSLDLGGTIAPGNSIGTLTVASNFTMAPTATYQAEIAPGNSDLIAVGGAATVNGGLNVLGDPSSVKGQTFTILTAGGGVQGNFLTLTSNNQIKYTVNYLSDRINVIVSPYQDYVDAFSKGDQSNAARTAQTFDALTTTVTPTSNPDLYGVFQGLNGNLATQNTAAVRSAMNQIVPQPEILTPQVTYQSSLQAGMAVRSAQQQVIQTNAIKEYGASCASPAFQASFDRLVSRQKSMALTSQGNIHSGSRKRNLAEAPDLQTRTLPLNERFKIGRANVWLQNYDNTSWIKSSRSPGARASTFGGVMGADYEIQKNVSVGIYGGGSSSPYHLKSDLGKGDIKSYYGGIYGTGISETGFYVAGQFMGGGNRYHSKRKLNFNNVHREAIQKHRGYQLFTQIEAGQILPISDIIVLQPFVNMNYAYLHQQGSRERGAGSLNFAVKSQNSQFMGGQAGLSFYRTFLYCETLLRPELSLAYANTSTVGKNRGKVRAHLIGEAQPFAFRGNTKTINQFAPSIALTAQFKDGLYLIGNIGSQLSKSVKTLAGNATIGYNF
ncbi:MAG: autotransporter domain-containing protein [Proteobacteria bacterium]|nr:autotransporter domain-containing protein [Pseudomonadota bacterium]